MGEVCDALSITHFCNYALKHSTYHIPIRSANTPHAGEGIPAVGPTFSTRSRQHPLHYTMTCGPNRRRDPPVIGINFFSALRARVRCWCNHPDANFGANQQIACSHQNAARGPTCQ